MSQVGERIDRLASREPVDLGANVRLLTAAEVRDTNPALSTRLVEEVVAVITAKNTPLLLPLLISADKTAALRVFKSIPFDQPSSEWEPWILLQCALQMDRGDPAESSAAVQKLQIPADAPDYRQAVGAFLHSVDPAAYDRRADLKSEKISGLSRKDSLTLALNLIFGTNRSSQPTAAPDPEAQAIGSRLKEMRGDLSQSDRASLAESLASGIGALKNPQARLGLASALSSLATEGDLGRKPLQAVTDTLGLAIRDTRPQVPGSIYVSLARLVRYEHMKSPIEDPSLDSRLELLHLRELLADQTSFTLTGIDGKTYALKDLRGKVVIVNFWATWCPPCRKEMPDLQQIYQRFSERGLVVLAISDEPADTVKPFIAKQGYTFPVLLDPDGKVKSAFKVEGIPKTFVFGRDGKLAAQAIDMRTREQFLALLKQAGLS